MITHAVVRPIYPGDSQTGVVVFFAVAEGDHPDFTEVSGDQDIAETINAIIAERDALQQLASERLALIQKIEATVDDGSNWEHTYDGDDSGEWVVCNGRDYIAALIADYREGPESQVKS